MASMMEWHGSPSYGRALDLRRHPSAHPSSRHWRNARRIWLERKWRVWRPHRWCRSRLWPVEMAGILKLRRYLDAPPKPPKAEVCEMCGVDLAGEHGHVIDIERRRMMCACRP